MGRRLFASYYLYYASNDAAATTSVANQLFREHLMLSVSCFTYMFLLTFVCLNMFIMVELVMLTTRDRDIREMCMTRARHVIEWHSLRCVSIDSKTCFSFIKSQAVCGFLHR